MPIRSFEMTADPNRLKLNLTKSPGFIGTYTNDSEKACQSPLDQLLAIEGISQIEVGQTYISLTRDPLVDWDTILDLAKKVIG